MRIIESGKEVRNRVRIFNLRYVTAGIVSLAGILTKDIPGTRDRLPEPIDVMDHVGNVNISWQTGAMAGLAIGNYFANKAETENRHVDVPKTRLKMATVGLAAGLLLNSFTETRFGLSVLDIWGETTPDLVDLAYGTTAATASAAVIPTFHTEENPANF